MVSNRSHSAVFEDLQSPSRPQTFGQAFIYAYRQRNSTEAEVACTAIRQILNYNNIKRALVINWAGLIED